jgi:peptidoglycan/LPS O-acetylase OafA/YrhL
MALAQLAPAAQPRDAAATQAPARLAYIDNLRALVIAMVIVHHAGQAYGPTGDKRPSLVVSISFRSCRGCWSRL